MNEHTFEIDTAEIREENPWQIDIYLGIFNEDDEQVGGLELNLLDDSEILNWEDACNFFEADDYPWFLKSLLRKLENEGIAWTGEKWEVR